MQMLRLATIFLSIGLHAALFLPFMSFGGGAALEAGTGDDQVVVEQGIALEGLAKFGEAEEMIETVDIPPVQAIETPQPVEEIKPELTDVVTSTEGKHEEQAMTEEPKPVEEVNDLSFETDYFFNSQVAFSAEPPDEHQFEGLIPEVNNPWFYF